MMRAVLALIASALVACSAAARADEMDGWCAQVKKASSIVICSDPELRQQAAARNKLFETAREKLSPEEYKALTEDQSRWIKSYTARCGVSLDGPVPALPVAQNVIDCYRRESDTRTAYLSVLLSQSTAAPITDAPQIAPGKPAWPTAIEWTAARLKAMTAWYGCAEAAINALVEQPEPAQAVVDAALGGCQKET